MLHAACNSLAGAQRLAGGGGWRRRPAAGLSKGLGGRAVPGSLCGGFLQSTRRQCVIHRPRYTSRRWGQRALLALLCHRAEGYPAPIFGEGLTRAQGCPPPACQLLSFPSQPGSSHAGHLQHPVLHGRQGQPRGSPQRGAARARRG